MSTLVAKINRSGGALSKRLHLPGFPTLGGMLCHPGLLDSDKERVFLWQQDRCIAGLRVLQTRPRPFSRDSVRQQASAAASTSRHSKNGEIIARRLKETLSAAAESSDKV